MDENQIVELTKARLGITSTIRDSYLSWIVKGVISELEKEKGIVLQENNAHHVMFCVDYATWRYQNRDSEGAMPRHLQYRMRNLIISAGGSGVDDV
ncbi:hypothetical protein J2S00_003071 [Caldalkalibacillus uzonensis]|uniref:Uncharacterized protein n=1 Tax=Caldalkalibacillus uzonensis TaxID=353224 RepID=A0ABU0CV17_9BACI|nr:hypothetical protein [Caldalkalibacillus uzonensis]MDQ0340266.1 hypothetical protein [Caldalkalibacillus uzonensis]